MNYISLFLNTIYKNKGAQIIFLIVMYLIASPFLSLKVSAFLFSISCSIKEVILIILPLTIGSFIAFTLAQFDKKAPLFLLALLVFEAISNFSSVMFAFFGARLTPTLSAPLAILETNVALEPLWHFPKFLTFLSASKGMLLGLFVGFLAFFIKHPKLNLFITKWKNLAEKVYTKGFSPLIPFFVLGFFVKMHKSDLLSHMFLNYPRLIGLLLCLIFCYLTLLFFAASDLTFSGLLRSFKNLLPAGAMAFSSGCSLSTMPWTIEGTIKNSKNPDFVKAVIPATINIQQIGDCITNCFLCYVIYEQYYHAAPSLHVWLNFSLIFVLARFTTAAVMGGAIFIMLPIYQTYLGFNGEMIALILAFNILLDPFVTRSNVLGNGALCRIFEKIWNQITNRFFLKKNSLD